MQDTESGPGPSRVPDRWGIPVNTVTRGQPDRSADLYLADRDYAADDLLSNGLPVWDRLCSSAIITLCGRTGRA